MIKDRLKQAFLKTGHTLIKTRSIRDNLPIHLFNVFEQYKIDCVLDVGANLGQYAQFIRELGFTGHIVSFEPQQNIFRQLSKHAENDLHWHCYNMALGEVSEDREINVFPNSHVLTSFHDASEYGESFLKSMAVSHKEKVRVERLDGLVNEIRRQTGCSRFYLKMDTQGFDLPAFRGASGMLNEVYAMQSELAILNIYNNVPSFSTMVEAFEQEGFRLCALTPENRDPSYALVEGNGVFVRR